MTFCYYQGLKGLSFIEYFMLRTAALAKPIPKSFAIMPFIPSPNSLAPFFNPSKIVIKAIVNGVKKLDQQFLTKYLRLLYVLGECSFTTSEMELDCYHQKLNVRVASWVDEWRNTKDLRKWGNFEKTQNWVEAYPSAHSLFQK